MINLSYEYQNGHKDEPKKEYIGGIWYIAPHPNFMHYSVCRNLFRIFDRHLFGKTCQAFFDGMDVYLTKEDHFVPDFMVVCDKDIIKEKGIFGAPDLVVEILSARTSKRDKTHKKNIYEKCGVKEYWLVDTKRKEIEVYWLADGRFVLNNVYILYEDEDIAEMTKDELDFLTYEFKTSIFDDLVIDVREVFDNIDI